MSVKVSPLTTSVRTEFAPPPALVSTSVLLSGTPVALVRLVLGAKQAGPIKLGRVDMLLDLALLQQAQKLAFVFCPATAL